MRKRTSSIPKIVSEVRRWQRPRAVHLFLVVFFVSIAIHIGGDRLLVKGNERTGPVSIYLPITSIADAFEKIEPIWTHSGPPQAHEVALFRKTFELGEQLKDPSLQIFADTRYQVWLDGQFLGRGPARFSQTLHEYDVYRLPGLAKGKHTLAILVQWSPNNRRSESITPYLQAQLQGAAANGVKMTIKTSPEWKALAATAWRSDAALVHAWGLIGSTEILDLRQLPANWMNPDFPDADWKTAVAKDISVPDYYPAFVPYFEFFHEGSAPLPFILPPQPEQTTATAREITGISYQPRSIEMLDEVEMPYHVIDGGVLSPGRVINEIPGGQAYTLDFQVLEPIVFDIETLLCDGTPPLNTITQDGKTLQWNQAGGTRPDVYTSSTPLSPGDHRLAIEQPFLMGASLSLPRSNILYNSTLFDPGAHAGRRMLLAEPKSNQDQRVLQSGGQTNITFQSSPGYVVLDLGRTVHGRLSAVIKGPSGTVVDIGWDERLLEGTLRPLPFPGTTHAQWNQVDSWILDGNSRSISTLDSRSGRYIVIAVWGEAPVEITNIQVHEERYPLSLRGDFQTPDPLLNRIWSVGVESIYPNMMDAYSDTPWRERGQWWGDAYLIDLANSASFGESALLRRGISFMASAFEGGQPKALAPNGEGAHMLDFGMLWVSSLEDHYRRTGDLGLLKETYPTLLEFLAYLEHFKSSTSGLLDLPEDGWSKTAYIDTYGSASRSGQSTAVNAQYYGTLRTAARIANLLNDMNRSSRLNLQADQVREKANELLYLPEEHRYLTSISGDTRRKPGPHAQAWALAYGLAPEEATSQIGVSLVDMLSQGPQTPVIGVYGMHWVYEALGKTGHIEDALDILKRYHGYMIEAGASTWWEMFNSNQFYWSSLSHGWGSSPTWFLSTYVLGARQASPTTWSLEPAWDSAKWVSGRLPLLEGELQAKWESLSCSERSIDLTSPPKASGEILLPVSLQGLSVHLDGQLVWEDGKSKAEEAYLHEGIVHIKISEGEHQLTLHLDCVAP